MEIPKVFPTIEEFAEKYEVALDDPDLEKKYRYYGMCVEERKSMIENIVKYDFKIAAAKTEEEREDARERRDSIQKMLDYLNFSDVWDRAYKAGREVTLDKVASAMRVDGYGENAIARLMEKVAEKR